MNKSYDNQANDNETNDNENNSLELDQLIIDRLVDDDLDDNEYREVLRLVEEKPDGWRKLAIAFLESQAFEKELGALKSFPEAEESASTLDEESTMSGVANFNDPSSKTETLEDESPSNKGSVAVEPYRNSGFWLGIRQSLPVFAASLAIVVTIGLYVREIRNNQNSQVETGQGSTTNTMVDPEFIELVSNDPDGRVQTPVYNHQQFDPGTYAQEIGSLKPRIQEVVNRPGWTADERTHVVPIKDKTGNRIIVPLKEIKLTPNSFAKYQ